MRQPRHDVEISLSDAITRCVGQHEHLIQFIHPSGELHVHLVRHVEKLVVLVPMIRRV